MKAGDILLFTASSGIGKIISWGTNSKYSHIAICVSPKMNLLIEAQAGWGVHALDTRQVKRPYDVFRVKEEFSYDLEKVISFLVANLNRKYDWGGVIYLGLLKVLHLKRKANKFQKDKDYFCSELVYLAFKAGGLILLEEKAGIASPGDIAKSEKIEKVNNE